MSREVIITVILAVIQIPIGVMGATMPNNKSKIPPIISGISAILIILLLFGYLNDNISEKWLLISVISLTVISVVATIIVILRNRKDKGSSALSKDDKKYMARLSNELHNVNEYYENLADTINVSKISQSKIKEIDTKFYSYMGLKMLHLSKPPKSSELFGGVYIIFYDCIKMFWLFIKARFSSTYLINLFLDLGAIPDEVGIGLRSLDAKGESKSEQLNKQLLRVSGERISSNETMYLILRHKNACYALNNIYLWLRMYPRGHKRSRLNVNQLLKVLLGYREKLVAYSSADVNKAIIKEFLD